MIKLAFNPKIGIKASKNTGKVELSQTKESKFKFVVGNSDKKLISIELSGAKGYFLRHQGFIIKLHQKPKENNDLFNLDSTFKVSSTGEPNEVMFESLNYPGHFISANDDGTLSIVLNPDNEQSKFIISK